MMQNELVQTFDAQVARHLRWNFTVNAADFALYNLALSFASMLTILFYIVFAITGASFSAAMISRLR